MAHSFSEWATADVSRKNAIAFWNELLCERVIDLDIESDIESGFEGRIVGSALSGQQAFMISAGHNQRAYHGLSARSQPSLREVYILIHMRDGHMNLKTTNAESHLQVGDTVLLSATEAFQFAAPARTTSLVLQFNHEWLRKRVPFADDGVARSICGLQGWGKTLSSALWNIDPVAVDTWSNPAVEVVEQVAGLVSLALQPGEARQSRGNAALAVRVRRAIDERFTEHDLTPQTVAETLGISKRYLHQVVSREGTTFGQMLMNRRLLEAQRWLVNAKARSLSITEIALNCGFSNANHFARVFRQANGRSPSAYRRVREN